MIHRDRAGDATGQGAGRREAAGGAGHRQSLPTPATAPTAGSPARPEAASQDFRPRGRSASRMVCDAGASPRHALLAENPNLEAWGKPSL